ncbi:MAG: class I SAM-dependent methyltransferase [Actinomycetota bacterium]|nr:class I SAM-dependent methyltransferase [Actinomycetota bacterium]
MRLEKALVATRRQQVGAAVREPKQSRGARPVRRWHPPHDLRADALALPLCSGAFDVARDRGVFHYLAPGDRARYAGELHRVLRPGGRLLARFSLRMAGV